MLFHVLFSLFEVICWTLHYVKEYVKFFKQLSVEPAYTVTSTAKDSIVIEQDAKYTEVY